MHNVHSLKSNLWNDQLRRIDLKSWDLIVAGGHCGQIQYSIEFLVHWI